jgi:hypothetical protein
MTQSSDDLHTDPPDRQQPPDGENSVGYKKPPKHSQFQKGRSGNPAGRRKAPIGISIKEILDGDQRGKNGEVISRRKAYVVALVREALRGNQQAFSKFMTLMNRSGLMRHDTSKTPMVIQVPEVKTTMEEFNRNFGRPKNEPHR